MIFTNGAYRSSAEAALVLLAVGCVADSGGMNLAAAVGAGMRVDDLAGIPLSLSQLRRAVGPALGVTTPQLHY